MSTLLSPGVETTEKSADLRVSPAAVDIGCYVGRATKGPVWQRTLVGREKDYVKLFGEPTDDNYEDFFTCKGFLDYGQNFYFTRVVDKDTAKNAEFDATTTSASAGEGDYIEDYTSYTPTFGASDKIQIFAKYPGDYGNTDFKVALINYTDWSSISTSPTLSGYESIVDVEPSATDEFVILVYNKNSDGDYEYAEQWLISTTKNKKDGNGDNIYVDDKINRGSSYILAFNNTSVSGEPYSFALSLPAGGADGTVQESDIVSAYTLYDNKEDIQVNYVIGGSHTSVSTAQAIITLCGTTRKDCFAALNVPKSDVVGVAELSTQVTNITDYRKTELNANTSYAALYDNWFYIKDNYNDTYRWVPSSGYVAGIYASSANVSDAWFAPAGLNRGIINNLIKLAINTGETQRNSLFKNQINSIVSFPGQGIAVWGDITLLSRPSGFQDIGIRFLFNYLKISISASAKYIVFEPLDDLTTSMFKNMVNPFLENVKGRRGLREYAVEVDDSAELIENNTFKALIHVKPVKSARYIQLEFVNHRQSTSFAEFG